MLAFLGRDFLLRVSSFLFYLAAQGRVALPFSLEPGLYNLLTLRLAWLLRAVSWTLNILVV